MTQPTQQTYPPRNNNGCLWGCLILLLILCLPPVLLGGYGVWFLYDGYKHNPVLKLVGELVRDDGLAQRVLGHGAVVTEVEGNVFSWVPGTTSNDLGVVLEGPKGEGRLAVKSHQPSSGPPILDSAILTGPDGRRYDLLQHLPLPDDPARPDTSI
ncbi:MAG TPA: hypothetical protein VJ753_01300 [Rhizomicrobium sp.]|nr:hypothetical protein [Rhizomicrobium sp.]